MRYKLLIMSLVIVLVLIGLSACTPTQYGWSVTYDAEGRLLILNTVLFSTSDNFNFGYQWDYETDEFGRDITIWNIEYNLQECLIMLVIQRIEDDAIYFYDNVNFIIKPIEAKKYYMFCSQEDYEEFFTEGEIAKLKLNNDWGKEINNDKLTKLHYSSGGNVYLFHQNQAPISNKKFTEEIGNMIEGDYSYYYCSTDTNGKTLWYIDNFEYINGEAIQENYVALFEEDGELFNQASIMKIKDIWNYSEQLAEFKERNGWNKP